MSNALSELQRLIDNLLCLGTIAEVEHPRRLRLDIRGRRTGWLPYPNEIGHNFRRWRPLRIGTQVLAACPSGDPANAVIVAILPTDALPPPAAAETLDLIEFDDGSRVEYDSAAHKLRAVSVGDIEAQAARNATLAAGGDLTATAGGTAAITAAVAATITAPAIGMRATRGGAGAAEMQGDFRLIGNLEITGDIAVTGSVRASGDIIAEGVSDNHHSHP